MERDTLRYSKDERPPFAFCESVAATGTSPWHIRRVVGALRFGGGIDSASLCKRVKSTADGGGGWDLEVRITSHHLSHACLDCVAEYRRRTGERRQVRHLPTGSLLTVLDRRDEETLERMLHTNECELGPSEGPMLHVEGHPRFEKWVPEKECEDVV